MADTTTMTMDGTWMAAAGEGYVTVTPTKDGYGDVSWATATPATAGSLSAGHIMKPEVDRAFDVPAGDQLYLLGSPGYTVVITRQTDPV